MFEILPERPADIEAVYTVNVAAFPAVAEAQLVDALRLDGVVPFISLVCVAGDRAIGHILFTPVAVKSAEGDWDAMALGPMAVLPEFQRRGAGSMLVRQGLQECRDTGYDVVFVLGHKEYYPRFGFVPTRPLGITCEFEVSEPYFMVAELANGSLAKRTGVVHYHPLFGKL